MHQELFNLTEYTSRSVFLTGKAGTGKTTFLNEFIRRTTKNYIVVAPTGIAAINAGGVTIHSMFGLPLSTFVPTTDEIDRNEAINIQQLLPHFKYRIDKLKTFRALDILIIDEVSMLRADVLDMIDLSLRSARRSTQKFGGVQLLLIGDLYQLPPVVKESGEAILYRFYDTPFFFSAKALQQVSLLTVELKQVYRQKDKAFLDILNSIRNNELQNLDFELLHSRYNPEAEPQDGYIYLVTHNYLADAINKKNLQELNSPAKKFEAAVTGDFRENLYPNDNLLSLKVGAQVMFIRNDTSPEKKYFNGMLARVTELAEDSVKVLQAGSENEIDVQREVWEHKKYYTDDEKKIQEDVVGSYQQLPLRLAWAVTIHKSQGLTFDKVIIDAGRSFSSGQVYVALSRCRTLEGIILKSIIKPSVIFTDDRIAAFQRSTDAGDEFAEILEAEKYGYAVKRMLDALDFSAVSADFEDWKERATASRFLDEPTAEKYTSDIETVIKEATAVFEKFLNFIASKAKSTGGLKREWDMIENKSTGAVNFFFQKVFDGILVPLNAFYASTKGVKGLKKYNSETRKFITAVEDYLASLKKATLLKKKPYLKREGDNLRVKVEKIPAHVQTFKMFEAGKTLQAIAEAREITTGTVFTHLSKYAALGLLDVDRLFSAEQLHRFETTFLKHDFESINECRKAFGSTFDFNEIRVLLNHFRYLSKKKESLNGH